MHKLPGRHRQQSGRTQVILGHRARWTDLCGHGKRSHSQRRVYGVYPDHNRIVRRRQSHADSNADGDTYTNANADSYRNSYSDGHGHGHGYSHSNSHSHSHGDTHTDGNADSYSHGNSNGHSHGYADSNSASCVANPNGHAQTDADAQAAADESSTGRALSGTLKGGNSRETPREFPA